MMQRILLKTPQSRELIRKKIVLPLNSSFVLSLSQSQFLTWWTKKLGILPLAAGRSEVLGRSKKNSLKVGTVFGMSLVMPRRKNLMLEILSAWHQFNRFGSVQLFFILVILLGQSLKAQQAPESLTDQPTLSSNESATKGQTPTVQKHQCESVLTNLQVNSQSPSSLAPSSIVSSSSRSAPAQAAPQPDDGAINHAQQNRGGATREVKPASAAEYAADTQNAISLKEYPAIIPLAQKITDGMLVRPNEPELFELYRNLFFGDPSTYLGGHDIKEVLGLIQTHKFSKPAFASARMVEKITDHKTPEHVQMQVRMYFKWAAKTHGVFLHPLENEAFFSRLKVPFAEHLAPEVFSKEIWAQISQEKKILLMSASFVKIAEEQESRGLDSGPLRSWLFKALMTSPLVNADLSIWIKAKEESSSRLALKQFFSEREEILQRFYKMNNLAEDYFRIPGMKPLYLDEKAKAESLKEFTFNPGQPDLFYVSQNPVQGEALHANHQDLQGGSSNIKTGAEGSPFFGDGQAARTEDHSSTDSMPLVSSGGQMVVNQRITLLRPLTIQEAPFRSCLGLDCSTTEYFRTALLPHFVYFTLTDPNSYASNGAITLVLGTVQAPSLQQQNSREGLELRDAAPEVPAAFLDKVQNVPLEQLPLVLLSLREILLKSGYELVLPKDAGGENSLTNNPSVRRWYDLELMKQINQLQPENEAVQTTRGAVFQPQFTHGESLQKWGIGHGLSQVQDDVAKVVLVSDSLAQDLANRFLRTSEMRQENIEVSEIKPSFINQDSFDFSLFKKQLESLAFSERPEDQMHFIQSESLVAILDGIKVFSHARYLELLRTLANNTQNSFLVRKESFFKSLLTYFNKVGNNFKERVFFVPDLKLTGFTEKEKKQIWSEMVQWHKSHDLVKRRFILQLEQRLGAVSANKIDVRAIDWFLDSESLLKKAALSLKAGDLKSYFELKILDVRLRSHIDFFAGNNTAGAAVVSSVNFDRFSLKSLVLEWLKLLKDKETKNDGLAQADWLRQEELNLNRAEIVLSSLWLLYDGKSWPLLDVLKRELREIPFSRGELRRELLTWQNSSDVGKKRFAHSLHLHWQDYLRGQNLTSTPKETKEKEEFLSFLISLGLMDINAPPQPFKIKQGQGARDGLDGKNSLSREGSGEAFVHPLVGAKLRAPVFEFIRQHKKNLFIDYIKQAEADLNIRDPNGLGIGHYLKSFEVEHWLHAIPDGELRAKLQAQVSSLAEGAAGHLGSRAAVQEPLKAEKVREQKGQLSLVKKSQSSLEFLRPSIHFYKLPVSKNLEGEGLPGVLGGAFEISNFISQNSYVLVMKKEPPPFLFLKGSGVLRLHGKNIRVNPEELLYGLSFYQVEEFMQKLNKLAKADHPDIYKVIPDHQPGDQYRLPREKEYLMLLARARLKGQRLFEILGLEQSKVVGDQAHFSLGPLQKVKASQGKTAKEDDMWLNPDAALLRHGAYSGVSDKSARLKTGPLWAFLSQGIWSLETSQNLGPHFPAAQGEPSFKGGLDSMRVQNKLIPYLIGNLKLMLEPDPAPWWSQFFSSQRAKVMGISYKDSVTSLIGGLEAQYVSLNRPLDDVGIRLVRVRKIHKGSSDRAK